MSFRRLFRLAIHRRGDAAAEVDDEIRFHLEMRVAQLVALGRSPEEARREATARFGDVERARARLHRYAHYRESIMFRRMRVDALRQDLTFALRQLRRAPGFTAAVALTFALGIGATTVMFSVVNGVLLGPLPFANAGRLVMVVNRGTRPYDAMSPLDLADWRRQVHAFQAVGSYVKSSANLTGGGVASTRLASADVTANWFTMFGVRPELGRAFLPGEDGMDGPVGGQRLVILSDALWRGHFGGDRGVIGRVVQLDGTPYTVVGVMPPRFTFPEHPDIWRPAALAPAMLATRGSRVFWGPYALLAPGVTFDQARQEARTVAARLHQAYPQMETGLRYDIEPLRAHLVAGSRTALLVLLAAVGCLLVIACANVATLLLVRATSRSAEIGVRLALGASPARVVRQLLVESVLLSVVGGALGVAIAELGVHTLVAARVGNLPLLDNVAVDARVLVLAIVVIIGTGVLFGLAPASGAVRTDVVTALKSRARGGSGVRGSTRLRSALVVAEVALAVPLLVGAGLLGRSVERLVAVDPGFRPEHVVRFDLTLPQCGTMWMPDSTCSVARGRTYGTPVAWRSFAHELLARLHTLPGTRAVGVGFGVPFTDWAINQTTAHVEGHPPESVDRPNHAESKYASPEYFAALGIPLLAGRVFTDRDGPNAPKVVLVNQAFVNAYLPGEQAVGKRLTDIGEIVGVVGDTKTSDLNAPAQPAVYQPYDQNPLAVMTVLIRSTADPSTVMRAARAQVAAIDRALAVFHMMPMEDAVAASASAPRLDAWVVGGFAGAALLLATVGIYGVIAYTVRERHRELGIRVALGADRAQVVGLVLWNGLRLTAVGVVVGLVAAMLGSRALASLLYDIAPTDPTTYAVVIATLFAAVIIASWLPARHAAAVDPLITMRPE